MSTDAAPPTIVFAPLNWGLGHATRIVPLVRSALDNGSNVIIASDGRALKYLRATFPGVEFLQLPSLDVTYSRGGNLFLGLSIQIPAIISWIIKDRKAARQLAAARHVDIILSDNRWGFSCPGIKSVFMTHQVAIKLPFRSRVLEYIAFRVQQCLLRNFSEIWVPDFEDKGRNISGDLSHAFRPRKPTRFIGLLSRFSPATLPAGKHAYDVTVILSGPEPQRTILQDILFDWVARSGLHAAFIGSSLNIDGEEYPAIEELTDPTSHEMETVIRDSRVVVCRSGYTSIMDMIRLQKQCVMIPTPGQTEQLYLAKLVSGKGWFRTLPQDAVKNMTAGYLFEDHCFAPPAEGFFGESSPHNVRVIV